MNDFFIPSEEDVIAHIDSALEAESEEKASNCVFEVTQLLLLSQGLPEKICSYLLGQMESSKFQKNTVASHLLGVFESNWEELSSDQRQRLLIAIESSYPLYADWMSCFVLSEILGTAYEPQVAVPLVARLAEKSSSMPRQFLPHVLEHALQREISADTRAEGLALLERFLVDEAPEVRNEAKESMFRIKNAFGGA